MFLCSNHLEILNVFNTLTFKQVFFKKPGYCSSVESAKTENASYRYKLSWQKLLFIQIEWKVKQMNYHKERSFASNYFIFKKILLRTSYKELI